MAELEHFVRIANTDLLGKKQMAQALTKIKGIGQNYAFTLCKALKLDPKKLMGYATKEEVEKFEKAIQESPLPTWMQNRRKDMTTGKDVHLTGADLKIKVDNEKKVQKRLKSYRGTRYSANLPVRGQKTKSNFRRSKGKAVGVKRKKK